MADKIAHDEFGHIATRKFPDGSIAGVIERPTPDGMKARLAYARNGNPTIGYDRVYWYDTIQDATKAMESWKYPGKPPSIIRDCHSDPVPWDG